LKPKLAPKSGMAPVTLSPDEIAFVRSLVIYEDPHILALNKPAGLSSQGGRGQVHTLDELVWAFAKPGKARPRLIHRLDRDTSGVILTAKTKPAAGFLGKAMMGRKFSKFYRAIVTPGAPEPKSGEITEALRRDEAGREAYMRLCPPIGRPIAGDARYGGALAVGGHAIPRLMLHAGALSFPHPDGGTKRIEAPIPEDMAGLIAALGLGKA
jgi:23S rRNA-/tRNA-specific pseudouridylate synthase